MTCEQVNIDSSGESPSGDVAVAVRGDLDRFRPRLLNRIGLRSTAVSPWLRRRVFKRLSGERRPLDGSGKVPLPGAGVCEDLVTAVCSERGYDPERPWGDARFLICLSFDIDSLWSVRNGLLLRTAEWLAAASIPATFFFVGCDYGHDDRLYDHLRDLSHEVGLHGIHHNYRDAYLPRTSLERKLDRLSGFVARHGIRGFRSPCYLKSRTMLAALRNRFFYDASFRTWARSVWTSDG